MTEHTHCIQLSGGVTSWAAGRIVVDQIAQPDDRIVAVFADTLIEDRDTYAFLAAAVQDLGCEYVRLADGRTPWQVFADKRYLGNSRVDPCSAILKRDLIRAWINQNLDPATSTIHLGIDWTEEHRLERARPRWLPYQIDAPLIRTKKTKKHWLALAKERGLPDQRLYAMGLAHANCGGGCVKAGQGHFITLLEQFPERFAEWEANEADLRANLGKDVAILRDWKNRGRPMTLADLRARHEAKDDQLDLFDIGGCGCAIDG